MVTALQLLTIFGGVALIVFGMRYLRKGLDRLCGQRLGIWMQRLAPRRGVSFLAGLGVSMLAPSSTTMSLLAVQTVRAGHTTASQMLTIMLGANVGLTIMVVLIGLEWQHVAPVILLAGVILFQFTRSNRTRGIGQVLLAVGFVLLAIDVMTRTAEEIDTGTGLWQIVNFDVLQHHPFLLALFAVIMAMLLQSSTATIALAIGLGAAEDVTFRLAVPVVIGANVGLGITTLLVGWREVEPRRLALGNLMLKTAVAVVMLAVVAIAGSSLPDFKQYLGLAIACVHTGFNVVVAAVGLPSVGLVSRLAERAVPALPEANRPFGPKYISMGPIGGAAVAMTQSQREIARVSEIIRGMLRDIWAAMRANNERLARDVAERDDQIDLLDAEIKRFLTRLVAEGDGEFDADEQMLQLRYLSELETIGDIIDKNLAELVLKKFRLGAAFSDEGGEDLDGFYDKVAENVMIAETAFTSRDRVLARQLLQHKERIDLYERELRDRHFARLNAGLAESHETSAIHLDLLTHLKRINSCVSHVGYAILQDSRPGDAPRPASGAGE